MIVTWLTESFLGPEAPKETIACEWSDIPPSPGDWLIRRDYKTGSAVAIYRVRSAITEPQKGVSVLVDEITNPLDAGDIHEVTA